MSAFAILQSEMNKAVSNRRRLLRNDVIRQINSLSFKDRQALEGELHLRETRNVRAAVKKNKGVAEKIQVTFPYQLYFVQTGTRRGVKKGSAKANPRPILDAVVPSHIKQLADEVVEIVGDNLLFNIPQIDD